MPEATAIHTTNPSTIAIPISIVLTMSGRSMTAGFDVLQERSMLSAACQEVTVTHAAMTAITLSVGDLSPGDPRHAAAHAAADLLQPRWREQLARVCQLHAATDGDLRLKAALLSNMVDRDEADAVVGGPAIQLAASLADDVLTHDWGKAG